MPHKILITITIFVFTITMSSCYNYYCSPDPGLRISTVGFSPSEINKIVVRRYNKGENFATLLDSLVIDSSNAKFSATVDTLNMTAFNGNVLMQSGNDYQVFFPVINKNVKITGIEEPAQKEKRGLFSSKNSCVNKITSYQVDGIAVSNTDGRLFIRR